MGYSKAPVVVAAGMKRSASTFQYNLLVSAFRIAGFGVWRGGRIRFHEETPDAEAYVVKAHRYDAQLADVAEHVFTSYRQPKFAWESYKRYMQDDLDIERADQREWLDWLAQWRHHEDYLMHFRDLVQRGGAFRQVCRHISHLRISPDPKAVSMMTASRCAPPENGEKDEDTLIFPNHYTGRTFDETLLQYRKDDE